ncbi:MAG: MoaD/ThiS family protein [Candidatus Thermoplasmatota archaeon]|jgi:sulfur carrier protein ThiS|nr:MoaD/ThiS family protein [Candidatus Thermoplasmatota archaeon]MCL5790995.1 MoaD/ThiS family protein [Candidatus Thermoplasmatota archaeon]
MIRVVGRISFSRQLEKSEKVRDVMEELRLSDERFVSLLNGTPVTGDEVVSPADDLAFIEIFSGG